MQNVAIFEFNKTSVEFQITGNDLMVNATQMAKIFDKNINNFIRNETTQAFIEACLNNANSRYLNVEKEEDLIVTKQKTGTYMHRVLALKFAAWLNPNFELWVYRTIDGLLHSDYLELKESLRQSAARKNKIELLQDELRHDERFAKLESLQLEERQSSYRRTQHSKNQVSLFRAIETTDSVTDN